MLVTVFGSLSATEADETYREAMELGRLLGRAGHAVCTGGYQGVMEAVSRGAHEAGGHVIGITVTPWTAFNVRANRWVREEIAAETVMARLERLLRADAFIAMHGGIGTLTEVVLAWQMLQIWEIPPVPLILVGSAWRALAAAFEQHLVIRRGDVQLLTVVERAADALDVLSRFDLERATKERDALRAELLKQYARG